MGKSAKKEMGWRWEKRESEVGERWWMVMAVVVVVVVVAGKAKLV
jgi:hypothetical protein